MPDPRKTHEFLKSIYNSSDISNIEAKKRKATIEVGSEEWNRQQEIIKQRVEVEKQLREQEEQDRLFEEDRLRKEEEFNIQQEEAKVRIEQETKLAADIEQAKRDRLIPKGESELAIAKGILARNATGGDNMGELLSFEKYKDNQDKLDAYDKKVGGLNKLSADIDKDDDGKLKIDESPDTKSFLDFFKEADFKKDDDFIDKAIKVPFKPFFFGAELLVEGTVDLLSTFTENNSYIFGLGGLNKEEREDYKNLMKIKDDYINSPVKDIQLNANASIIVNDKKINEILDTIYKDTSKAEELGPEQSNLRIANRITKRNLDDIENHLDKKTGFWDGLVDNFLGADKKDDGFVGSMTDNKIVRSGLGVIDTFDSIDAALINAKQKAFERGEGPELSFSEKAILKATAQSNATKEFNLNQDNFGAKLGATLLTSAELAVQMGLTGGIAAAGKQGLKAGFQKMATPFLKKRVASAILKKGVKEGVEEGGEALVREGAEALVREGAENAGKNIAAKTLTNEAVSEAGEQVVKKTGLEIAKGYGEKAVGKLTESAVQVAFMPHTYGIFGKKLTEPVVLTRNVKGEEIILVTKKAKENFEKENKEDETIQLEKLKRLNVDKEGNKDQIKQIEADLFARRQELDKIYEPGTHKIPEDITLLNAAWHAWTESYKEVVSEKIVGTVYDKFLAKPLSKFATSLIGEKLVSKVAENGVTKFVNNVGGHISKYSRKNAQYGEIFQSMPAEMFEELFVQAVPTYNAEKGAYVMSDYAKQLEEFKNPEFYLLTAASTGIMGVTTNSGSGLSGFSKHVLSSKLEKAAYNAQFDKGVENKKDLKDFYNRLGSSVTEEEIKEGVTRTKEQDKIFYDKLDASLTDDKKAELIAINTGKILEDQKTARARVAELRLKGGEQNDFIAERTEKATFNSMLKAAQQTDTVDDFEDAMKKVVKEGTAHPDTIKNAVKMLQYTIPAAKQIIEKHGDKINFNYISDLNKSIEDQKHALEGLEIAQQRNKNSLVDKIEEHKKAFKLTNDFSYDELFKIITTPALLDNYSEHNQNNIVEFVNDNIDIINSEGFNSQTNLGIRQSIIETNKEFKFQTDEKNQKEIAIDLVTKRYENEKEKNLHIPVTTLKAYKQKFNELGITKFDEELNKSIKKRGIVEAVASVVPGFVPAEANPEVTSVNPDVINPDMQELLDNSNAGENSAKNTAPASKPAPNPIVTPEAQTPEAQTQAQNASKEVQTEETEGTQPSSNPNDIKAQIAEIEKERKAELEKALVGKEVLVGINNPLKGTITKIEIIGKGNNKGKLGFFAKNIGNYLFSDIKETTELYSIAKEINDRYNLKKYNLENEGKVVTTATATEATVNDTVVVANTVVVPFNEGNDFNYNQTQTQRNFALLENINETSINESNRNTDSISDAKKEEYRTKLLDYEKSIRAALGKKEGESIEIVELYKYYSNLLNGDNQKLETLYKGQIKLYMLISEPIPAYLNGNENFAINFIGLVNMIEETSGKTFTKEEVEEKNNEAIKDLKEKGLTDAEKEAKILLEKEEKEKEEVEEVESQETKDQKYLEGEENEIVEVEVQKNRTQNTDPKLAFLNLNIAPVMNLETGVTSLKYKGEDLKEDAIIDNKYILDHNLIKEGTILSVKPSDYEDVKNLVIANYKFGNGSTKKTSKGLSSTFEEWCKSTFLIGDKGQKINWDNIDKKTLEGLTEAQKQYYHDKIPMFSYLPNTNIKISYIHDIDYYNDYNIDGTDGSINSQNANILKGRKNTSDLRNSIRNGATEIVVTKRTFGQMFKLNKVDGNENKIIPLSEATEKTQLFIYKGDKNTFENSKGDFNKNSDKVLVNDPKKLDKNQLYEIREVLGEAVTGENEGKKSYIALQVITSNPKLGTDLNDVAYNNVKFAVIAAAVLRAKDNPQAKEFLDKIDKQFNITPAKAEAIRNAIIASNKIDILSNINDYIKMFTMIDNSDRNHNDKLDSLKVDAQNKLVYPNDATYLNFNDSKIGNKKNNILTITTKKANLSKDSKSPHEKGYINFNLLESTKTNEKSTKEEIKKANDFFNSSLNFLNNQFGEKAKFKKSRFNASLEKLGTSNKFVEISENGEVNKDSQYETYDDYVKGNVKTTVKSFTIDSLDKDGKKVKVIVTDVHPVINIAIHNPSNIQKPISEEPEKKGANPETTTHDVVTELADKLLEDTGVPIVVEVVATEKTPDIVTTGKGVNKNGIREEVDYEDLIGGLNDKNNEENTGENNKKTKDGAENVSEKYNKKLIELKEKANKVNKTPREIQIQNIVNEYNTLSEELQRELLESGLFASITSPSDATALIENISFSNRTLTDRENEELSKINKSRVSTLSSSEQSRLTNSLFHLVIQSVEKGRLNKKSLWAKVKGSIEEYIEPIINNNKSLLEKITSKLGENSQLVKNFALSLSRIEAVLDPSEKTKIIGKEGTLTKKVSQFLAEDIYDEKNDAIEDGKEVDKNYGKSSMQEDATQTFGKELKMLFSGIAKLYENNLPVKNIFGLFEYESVDDIISRLYDVTTQDSYSIEQLQDKLANNKSHPIYEQLANKLSLANDRQKTELSYRMNMKRLNMFMLIHRANKNGSVSNIFYNVADPSKNKFENVWTNNYKNSDLFVDIDGNRVYDERKVHKLIIDIEDYKDNRAMKLENNDFDYPIEKEIKQVTHILKALGIELSKNTVIDMLSQMNEKENIGNVTMILFGAFQGKLYEVAKALELQKLKNNTKKDIDKINAIIIFDKNSEDSNPFKDSKGVLSTIVEIEKKYSGGKIQRSFRSNSKTLQGVIQSSAAYKTLESLKNSISDLFKRLTVIPYTKDNMLIKLLGSSSKLRKLISLSFTPLSVIKVLEKGKELNSSGDINELSESDLALAQISSFHNKLNDLDASLSETDQYKYRLSNMFFQAIADKGQMLVLSAPVLNLHVLDFSLTENNTVGLSEGLKSYLMEQLYTSELNRIISSHKNNKNTKIKNYDNASAYFLGMPFFNEVTVGGINIIDFLSTASHNQESLDKILPLYKEQAEILLEEFIAAKLKEKVDEENIDCEWVRFGFLTNPKMETKVQSEERKTKEKEYLKTLKTQEERDTFLLEKEEFLKTQKENLAEGFAIEKLDSKYIANFQDSDVSQIALAKMLALDFIVNDLLHKNNLHAAFIGDPALYAPKMEGFMVKDENGIETLDHVEFSKAMAVNLNKRIAGEIAPGPNIANSKGDSYIQIQVSDIVSITSTARALLKQYYGNVSKNNEKLLKDLESLEVDIANLYQMANNLNTKQHIEFEENLEAKLKAKKAITDSLKKENSEIAGFFDIESTDAQEYTTWKEHLDVIKRKGKLSKKERAILNAIYNKLDKGVILDKSELKFIMNPEKPVYNGDHNTLDKDGNPLVNRKVYIKSSSFPLLPQLTAGIDLDKVRINMEKLQKASGKNVRLSYQTANKVGSIDTTLTLKDLMTYSFEKLNKIGGKLSSSYLELNREGFRIQQENNYKTKKSLKSKKEDYIIMGSQMWKGLMANGIANIKEAIFPRTFNNILINRINEIRKVSGLVPISNLGNLTGKELNAIKFEIEKMYFDLKKSQLYKSLGMSTNGDLVNAGLTVEKLQAILLKESLSRNAPEYVKDGLALLEGVNGAEFNFPLWLNANANKFETLLLSFIESKTMKIKLPGYSHILGSSEGFQKTKVKDFEGLLPEEASQIVWLNGNRDGNLLSTHVDESGKLVYSEVLIQSKFRQTDKNGVTTLIDLTKEPYSKRDENGNLVLDKKLIDEALLKNFSFRIPTSGLQSGAMLQVVGFLPEAVGDLLIVPKEHTKQIGEDFDNDKRNVYKLHYTVNKKTGKISVLNYRETTKNKEGKTVDTSETLKEKMLENAIINVYNSVYTSEDNEIQKMINKILSMDNAVNAVKINNERIDQAKTKDRFFTPYSDAYQRKLLKAAVDGGQGTGVHSDAVSFQGQLERMEDKIQIKHAVTDENGDIIRYENTEIVIGNIISDGKLGMERTLSETDRNGARTGKRTTSDVNAENQNSALDNIKAGIMALRNENKYTMSVLTQLTYRGFDAVNSGTSENPIDNQVTSLFLSQPILRRFSELMSEKETVFNGKKSIDEIENEVFLQLIAEYDKKGTAKINPFKIDRLKFIERKKHIELSKTLTGDNLYNDLIDDSDIYNSDRQLAVLQTFFMLKAEAAKLSVYQGIASVKGLGFSYFTVLDKIRKLNDLGKDIEFENIRNLIGIFSEKQIDESYIEIGDFYIKPTTSEGVVLVNSLEAAQKIMDTLYPYKNNILTSIVNIINPGYDSNGIKRNNLINDFKTYLFTNQLGFFKGPVKEERDRLIVDSETNMSLANFLNNLKNSNDKTNLMFTNDLLKSLILNVNKGGISTIDYFYNNDVVLDGGNQYEAFAELVEDDTTDLGMLNGKKMTPRSLAQDLASYAYLSKSEGGATGFKQFINIEYLNILGISENVRNSFDMFFKNVNSEKNRDEIIDNFIYQYYQHNSNEIKVDWSWKKPDFFKMFYEGENILSGNVNHFYIERPLNKKGEYIMQPAYIKIKTPLGVIGYKQNLIDEICYYTKMETLGSESHVEYNYEATQVFIGHDSTVLEEIEEEETKPEVKKEDTFTDTFGPNQAEITILSVLKQLNKDTNNPKYKEFITNILPFLDTETKLVIFSNETNLNEIFNLDINNPANLAFLSKAKNALGFYDSDKNSIFIADDILGKSDRLSKNNETMMSITEEVLMEEILHSITVNAMLKHGQKDANGVFIANADAPLFVTKLVRLLEFAKENKQAIIDSYADKTKGQKDVDYYTGDILEFIANVFSSNDFRAALDNVKIGNKSLLERFKESIISFLNSLKSSVPVIEGKTYSESVRQAVYDLLAYEQLSKKEDAITKEEIFKFKQIVNLNKANDAIKQQGGRSPFIDINNIETISNNLGEIKDFKMSTANTLIQRLNNGETILVAKDSIEEDTIKEYTEIIFNHFQNKGYELNIDQSEKTNIKISLKKDVLKEENKEETQKETQKDNDLDNEDNEETQENNNDSKETEEETKKEDIEKRRQEELESESYRIPISKESQKWVNEDGTNFETIITTNKDGSKQTRVKNLDDGVQTEITKYSARLLNSNIYEVESANAISRENPTIIETGKSKIKDKINAKYDVELKELESANESQKQNKETTKETPKEAVIEGTNDEILQKTFIELTKKIDANTLYQSSLFKPVKNENLIVGNTYFIMHTNNSLFSTIGNSPMIFKGEFHKQFVTGKDGGYESEKPIVYTLNGTKTRLNVHTEKLVVANVSDFSKESILKYWIEELKNNRNVLELHAKDDGKLGFMIDYNDERRAVPYIYKYYTADFKIEQIEGVKDSFDSFYDNLKIINKKLVEKYEEELKGLSVNINNSVRNMQQEVNPEIRKAELMKEIGTKPTNESEIKKWETRNNEKITELATLLLKNC